ncbi:MAG: Phasin [Rhodobacterales bacterium CG2_30_65_12]|nr:MAG: Phasin [Rhodobacterales bacterium CG2_30_65_12]
MTTKTDYTKMMQDMMGAFPMDMSAFEDAFKSQAALGEKFSRLAIDAAEKSVEVSTRWTKDTLSKVGDMTAAKTEAADYSKAMTDFASSQAEMAAENMSAFAEIAKKVQTETVELMLSTGKDMSADATAAMKKASEDVSKAARKATQTAK